MTSTTNTRRLSTLLTIALALPFAFGAVACKGAYYSTMEKFGVHKRDILVDRVEDARSAQIDAKESFVDALAAFRRIQDFDGGSLDTLHKDLSSRYDRCEARVQIVRERIAGIESVSDALFTEWRGEIGQIQDSGLRSASEDQYASTQARYEGVLMAMKRAESRMEPVLVAFNDRVLFLKHNLNSQAISSLQGTLETVETDVESLIEEMEASIAEADEFVAGMATATT